MLNCHITYILINWLVKAFDKTKEYEATGMTISDHGIFKALVNSNCWLFLPNPQIKWTTLAPEDSSLMQVWSRYYQCASGVPDTVLMQTRWFIMKGKNASHFFQVVELKKICKVNCSLIHTYSSLLGYYFRNLTMLIFVRHTEKDS